jgi:hypothetical protein
MFCGRILNTGLLILLLGLCQILRIGVYEIVKLDMPPYAVVDEVFHWPNYVFVVSLWNSLD